MIHCKRRTLPMRNWYLTNLTSVGRRHSLRVGHYLWGIDTQQGVQLWCIQQSSDITYEELIRIVLRQFVSKLSMRIVGHYLWGIDTMWKHQRPESRPLVQQSDITYEELIHSIFAISQLRISRELSSDITYEELIPNVRWEMTSSSSNMSDITYEELILEGLTSAGRMH